MLYNMIRKENRRIAFILGSLKRGGAERVVSNLANHYNEKGWKVDILLLLSSKCEYKLNEGVSVIPLNNNDNKSRIMQLPSWLKGIRWYLLDKQPDTVLSFAARINIISALAGLGIKKNFVVSERNDPMSDGRSLFIKIATKLIYPHTNKVVFQTKRAQSSFDDKVINNSVIIYNPVFVKEKASMVRSNRIVAVGRLEKQKNHELLIDAFNDIHKLFPNYKLIIYGEGSLRKLLENKIINLGLEDSIMMPGNIENIHQEMVNAEMFVLPSNYEGLSNALLEAMMMGLPCISTNCAGSDEVIKNRENGLLVPVGSKENLIEVMKELIVNRELGIYLGKQAQETSRDFNSEIVIKQWEVVLEK